MLFFSLFHMNLFLYLWRISLSLCTQKVLPKVGGLRKKIRGDDYTGGLAHRRRIQTFRTLWTSFYHLFTWVEDHKVSEEIVGISGVF